ncbi:MAG: S8 family serine peptidase, partial [Lachnospiraceae bacterium]|nr:S8 family serine peptidase [Lachnospiraceae bacterium]
ELAEEQNYDEENPTDPEEEPAETPAGEEGPAGEEPAAEETAGPAEDPVGGSSSVEDETAPAENEEDLVGEGPAPPVVEVDTAPAESEDAPALIPHVDDIVTIFERQQVTAEDLAALERLQSAKAYSEADLAALAGGNAPAAVSDPGFSQQWHLSEIGIGDNPADPAHPWSTSRGAGVTVAVIDSGIARNHPDLKANIAAALNTCSFATNGPEDNNGHGTHVSGIIAAVADNGRGVAGVAPGAKIVSIKCLDYAWDEYWEELNHYGLSADIARAVNLAVSRKVDIINMSLGGWYGSTMPYPTADLVYEEAVANAINSGVAVIVAAGNEYADRDGPCYQTELSAAGIKHTINGVDYYYKCFPAQFPDVITVSASTIEGDIADYSNRGLGVINVGAPGSAILSTWLSSGYLSISGTSMATPVVSGVAALVIAANPALRATKNKQTVADLTAFLQETANKTPYYNNANNFGAGLVSAKGAMDEFNKYVPAPTLSAANGSTLTAENATGTVALTVTNPAAYIAGTVYYYTQDGQAPTMASPQATDGSLIIETNGLSSANVRVVAARNGKFSSPANYSYQLETRINALALTSATGAASVAAGKTLALKAAFTPSQPSNTALEWESSDSTVATVNANTGLVTALAPGSATITATATDGSGKTASLDITVRSLIATLAPAIPAEVAKDGSRYALATQPCTYKGASRLPTLAFALTAKDSTGEEIAIAPSDFTFKSSNEKIATVDTAGTIRAVASGNATITATARDGSGKKATINVNVAAPARIISITNKEGQGTWTGSGDFTFTVARGKSITLTANLATPTTDPAGPAATNRKLTWATDDASIRVTSSGKITGVSLSNSATVTVQPADGVQNPWTIKIIVVEPTTALKIAPDDTGRTLTKVTLTLGAKSNLDPDNRAEAGSAYNFGKKLTGFGDAVNTGCIFTSSNPRVATVDELGVVTAVNTGTAKITARITNGSGRSVSLSVNVRRPMVPLDDFAVWRTTGGIAEGKKMKMYSSVYKTCKASNKKLKWSVTNPAYFTVSGNGTVGAKKGAAGKSTSVLFSYVAGWKYNGQEIPDTYSLGSITAYRGAIKSVWFDSRRTTSLSVELMAGRYYDLNYLVNSKYPDSYENLYEPHLYTVTCTCRGAHNHYFGLNMSSSNNKVAGASNEWRDISTGIPGKATVTLTTADGSNKKLKIKVTVRADSAGLD